MPPASKLHALKNPVVAESSVLRINICAEIRHFAQRQNVINNANTPLKPTKSNIQLHVLQWTLYSMVL